MKPWWESDQWAGFCAAVADNPADDTVRLVACDWLEGDVDDPTADARAAVIRKACERDERGNYVERHVQYGANYKPTYPAFPEPVFRDLARFETIGGFPVGVTFYAHKFDKPMALALKMFPIRRADLWPWEPRLSNPDNPGTGWDIGGVGPEGPDGLGFRSKAWLTVGREATVMGGGEYLAVWRGIEEGLDRESILTRFYLGNPTFVPRDVWAHLRRGRRGGTVTNFRRAEVAFRAVANATFLAFLNWQGVNPTDPRPPVATMPVESFRFGEVVRGAYDLHRETFPEVYAAGPVG